MGLLRRRMEETIRTEYRDMAKSDDLNILYFDAMIDRESAGKARRLLDWHGRGGEKLLVILTTDGGLMTEAEAMVMDWRHRYSTVIVAIPEYAMSSGAILALSADHLYMKYSACIGPIDTQTFQPDGSLRTTASYARYAESLLFSKNLTPREEEVLKGIDWGRVESERKESMLPCDILNRTINGHILDGSRTVDKIAFELSNELKWLDHGRQIRRERMKDELGIVAGDYKLEAPPWGVRIDGLHEMEQEFKAFVNAKGVLFFYGSDEGGYGCGREFLFEKEGEGKKT